MPVHLGPRPPSLNHALQRRDVLALALAAVPNGVSHARGPPTPWVLGNLYAVCWAQCWSVGCRKALDGQGQPLQQPSAALLVLRTYREPDQVVLVGKLIIVQKVKGRGAAQAGSVLGLGRARRRRVFCCARG